MKKLSESSISHVQLCSVAVMWYSRTDFEVLVVLVLYSKPLVRDKCLYSKVVYQLDTQVYKNTRVACIAMQWYTVMQKTC